MKKKKNFIVLIAIALLFILAVPVSAASGTMKLNKTRVSMYYAQSSRQQRKNKVSIMEIQQYTDRNG